MQNSELEILVAQDALVDDAMDVDWCAASADEDSCSSECDGDRVDREIDAEYEKLDEEDYFAPVPCFGFVILSRDARGRPVISSHPLLDSWDEVRSDELFVTTSALFAAKIRHYLTYHRPLSNFGPRDFVYYLAEDGFAKRHDPLDPDHDQVVPRRTYSPELQAKFKKAYLQPRGKSKKVPKLDDCDMAPPNWMHNHYAVVVHRDAADLQPSELTFERLQVEDQQCDSVTFRTMLMDMPEFCPHDRWECEPLIRGDFPLLFCGVFYHDETGLPTLRNEFK